MGEPLANSMGKWIAGTEAKTTEHNIFNGKKKKDKWKGRTVLHSRIIFHTFRRLFYISVRTQLFMLLPHKYAISIQ